MEIKWNKSELDKASREILKRIEHIIFTTTRQTPKKRNGRFVIEDSSGQLRRTLKSNTNIFETSGKNLDINVEMVEWFFYLDEGTKHMQGWFIQEAIFEDTQINKILKDLIAGVGKRAVLEFVQTLKDN